MTEFSNERQHEIVMSDEENDTSPDDNSYIKLKKPMMQQRRVTLNPKDVIV